MRLEADVIADEVAVDAVASALFATVDDLRKRRRDGEKSARPVFSTNVERFAKLTMGQVINALQRSLWGKL